MTRAERSAPSGALVDLSDLPSHEEYVLHLHEQVAAVKARVERFRFRKAENHQDEVLIHCLERAADLGEGCLLVGQGRLALALSVLVRTLTETLFLACWASLSVVNAQSCADASNAALARIARSSLEKGRARIRDTSSGQDQTATVLPHIQGLEKPPLKVEQMARETGLAKVYDLLYRFESTAAHSLAPWTADKHFAPAAREAQPRRHP